MTFIYINKKFPKGKKQYETVSEDNTEKLKEVMSKLTITKHPLEPEILTQAVAERKQGAKLDWAYSDKKKKIKTFRL